MDNAFFEEPILNSPYEYPRRHWELDESGQPTGRRIETRRPAKLVSPIPKPKKAKRRGRQQELDFADDKGLGEDFNPTPFIGALRRELDTWRKLPPDKWRVTPTTQRLLTHWRTYPFNTYRPFFCQREAVEAAIWLTEVAPRLGSKGKYFLERLEQSNAEANPELMRLALKLATGAGKTTVMAMLIAWQTLNAVRAPHSKRFTRGFLVVAPGLTIKDRLRVLMPNDPDSYYRSRELVPLDLLPDLQRAKIVVTNYHAFKLRERVSLAKGSRQLLQGRGPELETLETEGQMIQRVMPDLMGMRGIMVLNDEAHHCYREKPETDEEKRLRGDDKREAQKNNEAARLWISGLEAVNRKLGIHRVIDLSATPFFLRGSGYPEGTLFPWTMSDFSLMDAIECGIVKLPRVPIADNLPNAASDMPKFRELWKHVKAGLPKAGRRKSKNLDPRNLPTVLQTALEALYGHYEKTFDLWQSEGIRVPPCFIVVCQNTAISKLVYDFLSGFLHENEDGTSSLVETRFKLFSNYSEHGDPLPRPKTLLIDSEQLESGEALDTKFRKMAADEIERFRREEIKRTGDQRRAENISDQELLREVMNTVGKEDRLGEQIRCVVSVSMLTEGWDANNVTHVLGVRAFGTQLLCEQVIGRALRRQSYDLNEKGRFNVEYADVLGIPFDFATEPVYAKPQPPRHMVQVMAVRPKRDALEIQFPNVQGYRVELPKENLKATFTEDSELVLDPSLVGPSVTRNAGIIGEEVDLNLMHLEDVRHSTLIYHLTRRLLYSKLRDPGEEPKLFLFGQVKKITKRWLREYLVCKGNTFPAQLMYQELADMACDRIMAGITSAFEDTKPIKAVIDPYNPTGSTQFVRFQTAQRHWRTDPRKCHVNYVVLDSDWEAEFCRVVEAHRLVNAYVKNHSLGFEVPYQLGAAQRRYRPDFIVLVDDGQPDPLHLVVEIKGFRGEDAKQKKLTMDAYWVPGVNHLQTYGRWAFAEFTDVFEIEAAFNAFITAQVAA